MSTIENVLLVSTDPISGKTRIGSGVSQPMLGGAILFDLVSERRLVVEGSTKRRLRVAVADPTPVGNPVLDAAFDRVRHRGRQAPRTIVGRLGKQAQRNTYALLTARGLVSPRRENVLGLFPVTRHDVLAQGQRDQLVQATRAVLVHEQPADATTGPIIGLLAAADLLKLVVERPDLRAAKRRAKVVTQGDWASEAVRDAVQAAQAAVVAGVMAASVAASS